MIPRPKTIGLLASAAVVLLAGLGAVASGKGGSQKILALGGDPVMFAASAPATQNGSASLSSSPKKAPPSASKKPPLKAKPAPPAKSKSPSAKTPTQLPAKSAVKPAPPVKKPVAAKPAPTKPPAKPAVAKTAPKPAPAKPAAKTVTAKPVAKPASPAPAKTPPVKPPPAATVQKPAPKPAQKPAAPAKPVAAQPAPKPALTTIPFAATPFKQTSLPVLPPLPIFWQPPPHREPSFRHPLDNEQVEALKVYLGLSPLQKPAPPPKPLTFSVSLSIPVRPNPIDLIVRNETEEEYLSRRDTAGENTAAHQAAPPDNAAPAPEAAPRPPIMAPRRVGTVPRTPHQALLAQSGKTAPAPSPAAPLTLLAKNVTQQPPPAASLPAETPLSPSQPVTLADGRRVVMLHRVLREVMTSNKELAEKRAKLDEIDANELGLKSRYSPHFNMVAKWDRNKNDFLNQNFPPLELSTLTNSGISFGSAGGSSLGGLNLEGLDLGSFDLGSLDTSSLDLNSLDLGSLGIDTGSLDLGSLDLNSLDLNDLSSLTSGELDLSTVDLNSLNLNDLAASNPDLLSQFLGSGFGGSGGGVNIAEDTRLSVQFARRVYEFGRENTQDIQLRERRRQAYVDYEKKLREILAQARKRFFTALLKEKQIQVRAQLLKEFQSKHDRLKTRFEQAQDILKIDVLTAELDVLNERLVINGLEKEKATAGIDLARFMGEKYDPKTVFAGELDRFAFGEDDVTRLVQKNSFASHLLREQVAEQRQILKDMVWTWRPSMALRGGVEYRHASVGVGLNQSGGTFGVDVGAESYLNLPDLNMNAFDGDKEKYALTIGMNWPFYSGKDRAAVMNRERAVLDQLKAKLKAQEDLEQQQARTAFQTLREARERERLQAERVNISRRRLQITQVLRDSGKVSEVSLETFRDRFFSDQDSLFREQNNVIEVQETLRQLMGVFE